MKKIIRNTLGIILLIFGIIGGFLPIIQGWIFVLAGFILLDFKRKDEYEEKFLKLISRTKLGKKLADFWINIKNKNKAIINGDKNKKLNQILTDLEKKEDNSKRGTT